MLTPGTLVPDGSSFARYPRRVLFQPILALALLVSPQIMFAQHGGGGRITIGGGGGGLSRPDGVSEKDDLKDFHRALALQATAEQRAAFAKVEQYAQAAADQIQSFRKSLAGASPLSGRATTLDTSIAEALASHQNFLTSLSALQKSDLKEILRRLEKAQSDLEKQVMTFDQIVESQAPRTPDDPPVARAVETLEHGVAAFQNDQFALAREMSIRFPDTPDVSFSLPTVSNSVRLGAQTASLPVSGVVSRISTENGRTLFHLTLVANLSDLQENFSALLRSELDRSPDCGERLAIQEGTILPQPPGILVTIHLHYERWFCPPGQSLAAALEFADAEADMDLNLTPSVQSAGLALIPKITRVAADGFFGDALRSGDLGAGLRDQTAAAILGVIRQATDFTATLPPVAAPSATLQKARFQDDGVTQFNLVLDGELQFSDQQTQQFVAQLNQRQSAQGSAPPQ
jgi:hypothetical protein